MLESFAIQAEQAMLGAVLLDPAGKRHVLGLVEPGDMFRPWHGQVLTAMRRVGADGRCRGRWRCTGNYSMILICRRAWPATRSRWPI